MGNSAVTYREKHPLNSQRNELDNSSDSQKTIEYQVEGGADMEAELERQLGEPDDYDPVESEFREIAKYNMIKNAFNVIGKNKQRKIRVNCKDCKKKMLAHSFKSLAQHLFVKCKKRCPNFKQELLLEMGAKEEDVSELSLFMAWMVATNPYSRSTMCESESVIKFAKHFGHLDKVNLPSRAQLDRLLDIMVENYDPDPNCYNF